MSKLLNQYLLPTLTTIVSDYLVSPVEAKSLRGKIKGQMQDQVCAEPNTFGSDMFTSEHVVESIDIVYLEKVHSIIMKCRGSPWLTSLFLPLL